MLFPAALHLRFDRHGLERLNPGHALDQKGLVLGAARELVVEPLAKQRRRRRRNADIERERTEHDRSKQRRIDEHHRQKDEREEQVDYQRQRGAGEKVADILQLAHARDRIADPPRLEIGDRQRQQVAEQAGAQLDIDAVGRVREQIGAQDAQNCLEQRNGDQPDDQNIERAECPIDQNLVDDDLEEQRRNQRKELEEERGDENLAEQIAVLVDGAEEPGDVEAAGKVQQAGATGHQHKTAVPDRLEFCARHEHGPRRQGILNENLVLAGFAEKQIAAVAQHRDAGQRCFCQPLPVRLIGPRLKPEFLGAAQHFRHAKVVAETVADLRRDRRQCHGTAATAQGRRARTLPEPVCQSLRTPHHPPTIRDP